MKTKNNQTALSTKDITDALTLANFGLESIEFIIDYWNKTLEEREEIHENIKRFANQILSFIELLSSSPENEQTVIMVELRKLGEKLAIAKLHKILGINTPDISNEMNFENPYQYPEDR